MLGHVVEVEGALLHLLGDLLRLLDVDRLRGLLHERDDVAHAEDARGDARGVEILQRIPFLADAHELDGLAGDRAHRQRRAAARVAVGAREHDAGDADARVERLGDVDGVLAGEAVGDEQRLVGMHDVADLHRLRHERFVDVGAPRRVEHDHVVAAKPRGIERAARDLLRRLARNDGERLDLRLLAQDAQLLLRRRPPRVERGHQHFLLVAVGKPLGDLGRGRRLAGALQADEHDRDRRRGMEIDRHRIGAQHGDELVVHDLDNHLPGGDRAQNLLADGLRLDLLGEVLDDVERHVGLDERAPHLAHGFADVALGERAAPRQLVEDARKAIRQRLKHASFPGAGGRAAACAKRKRTRGRNSPAGVDLPASRYRSAGRAAALGSGPS